MVISDPHIKVDPDYSVYAKAKEQGFFVKNPEGGDFQGVCWPGMVTLIPTGSVPTDKTSVVTVSFPVGISFSSRHIFHHL